MVLVSSPVAVTSPSDFAPASSKEFLDIQATIECGFTLKCVREMTRTYSYLFSFEETFEIKKSWDQDQDLWNQEKKQIDAITNQSKKTEALTDKADDHKYKEIFKQLFKERFDKGLKNHDKN